MSATFTPPLSEQVADAIRTGNDAALAAASPFAAALKPLLTALGWRSFGHDVIECLPHFSATLDLADFRNMLAVLGYESDLLATGSQDLDADLLPCLLLGQSGGVFVITERTEAGYRYFDAVARAHKDGPLRIRGTGYVFTDRHATHAVGSQPPGEWFTSLVTRFRKLIKHLLAITAALNIIALAVPLFIMTAYDRVIGTKTLDALPALAVGMAFVLLVELGLRFVRARALALVASRLDYLIGVETFKQIISLPPILSERSSVAAQLSTLKQFDSVRDFFTGSTAALALEAPFVVLLIAVMWLLAGSIALVPVVMICLYALFGALWLPGMNRRVTAAGAARTARQTLLMETLSGLRELKALGAEWVWRERFRETSADTLTALYATATSQAVAESVTYALMTLSGVAVLGIGALQVMDDELSVGALIAVMALLWRVLGPIQGLFMGYVKFDQIIGGVRTINQLMKLRSEPTTGKSALVSSGVRGAIRFDRVSFRYGPKSDPALLGVSLSVRPKEFIAVLGGNGSGKSTLLKLIAGVYTAQSGSVYIDDVDSRQFNPVDLRRLVAYVPQTPYLFHGSIAQNLRFKNVMAGQADLERAADQAGILDQIRSLPQGFETRVGDHTTDRLPSGLLRGLCLARAFVRPAAVVLLDEPAASLDHESDAALVDQIERLRGQHTIIMVSHRPSHIRLADRALLIDGGVLQFVGSPSEVLDSVFKGAVK